MIARACSEFYTNRQKVASQNFQRQASSKLNNLDYDAHRGNEKRYVMRADEDTDAVSGTEISNSVSKLEARRGAGAESRLKLRI